MRGFVMAYDDWAFPRGFAAIDAACPHADVRDKIIDNPAVEHGIEELIVAERHIDMVKRFGIAGLGPIEAEDQDHTPRR